MYESKYMIKMVGIRSISMFLNNFFSSSGVYGDSSGAFSIFMVSESVFCLFSSSIIACGGLEPNFHLASRVPDEVNI